MSDPIEAVSVKNPSKPSGSPIAWRSHETTTVSSSVPIGDVRHRNRFWASEAMSISPAMPAAELDVGK